MAEKHTPVILRTNPTDEELDSAIATAESRGWYGLLGMLKELKQLRKEKEAKT